MSRLRVVVDNRVRLPTGTLPEGFEGELQAAFDHPNPQWQKLRGMGYSTKGEPAVVRTWRYEPGAVSFPRGGMGRVRDALRRYGVAYEVADERVSEERAAIPGVRQEPWPFQRACADALIARENALLRAPTGGGKTSIAIACAARLCVPTCFIVWNSGLFEQWRVRLQKELGLRERDVGVIRAGKWNLKPVTVAMQQTLSAKGELPAEVNRYFGCVIADEVQRAASDTMYAAVDQFGARYRFGISADERRKDGKDFVTRDLFGDVAAEVDREQLVREGFILDVEIRVHRTSFEAPWYGHPSEGRELDNHRLLEELTSHAARNGMVVSAAMREVEAGEQVIVLSRRVEHCKLLCRMLVAEGVTTGFLLGGADNRLEFRRSVAGLASGEIRVGVGTYEALGTGIDLPSVAVAVAATPIAGNKQFFNQVRGRVCRTAPGKSGARMHYFLDPAVHPGHLHNLVKWNESVRVFTGGGWVNGRAYVAGLRSGTRRTA
jgi:superfamily II DNA or RNA helicase